MNIQKIHDEIAQFESKTGSKVDIGEGVDDRAISASESALGFKLCDDYCEFLQSFGFVDITGVYIFGIYDKENYLDDSLGEFIYETQEAKSNGASVSAKCTLIRNESDEFYVYIDHESSNIFTYDPFSKKVVNKGINLEQYLIKLLEV